MLYKFKLGHNAAKATKNICCAKGERTVYHSIVTKGIKGSLPGVVVNMLDYDFEISELELWLAQS